jgi:hypothetical protein
MGETRGSFEYFGSEGVSESRATDLIFFAPSDFLRAFA